MSEIRAWFRLLDLFATALLALASLWRRPSWAADRPAPPAASGLAASGDVSWA